MRKATQGKDRIRVRLVVRSGVIGGFPHALQAAGNN